MNAKHMTKNEARGSRSSNNQEETEPFAQNYASTIYQSLNASLVSTMEVGRCWLSGLWAPNTEKEFSLHGS